MDRREGGMRELQLTNSDDQIPHLLPIIQQLIDLWKEPEKDDYGRLRPTRDAFGRSMHLLVDVVIEAHPQRLIPAGCVSTDSEGSVRIEWVCPTASVHLVVPAKGDRVAFIYHEIGDDYATEDATPERLAYWLRQIN
jgi:hypothetical protein